MWAQRVLALLEQAMRELDSEADAALSVLVRAVSLLREQRDAGAQSAVVDGRARLLAWQAHKVCAYIDAHVAEPLRVADLSAIIRRSEAHFSRLFKQTFGEPPHAFLIRRRLRRAEECMLETDASLSDIALRCGFTDHAHLCKHFRRITGRTPASWRRARRASTTLRSMEADLALAYRGGGDLGRAGRPTPRQVRKLEEADRFCPGDRLGPSMACELNEDTLGV
jgi:AraC family transcriptional regulator